MPRDAEPPMHESEEIRFSDLGIRFAQRNERGQLEVGEMLNLDMLGGTLPAVGDVFATLWREDRNDVYRVISRYYIGEFKGDNCWWLLVEEVEPTHVDLAMFQLARRESEETRGRRPPEKGYPDLLEMRKILQAAKAKKAADAAKALKAEARSAKTRRPGRPRNPKRN